MYRCNVCMHATLYDTPYTHYPVLRRVPRVRLQRNGWRFHTSVGCLAARRLRRRTVVSSVAKIVCDDANGVRSFPREWAHTHLINLLFIALSTTTTTTTTILRLTRLFIKVAERAIVVHAFPPRTILAPNPPTPRNLALKMFDERLDGDA